MTARVLGVAVEDLSQRSETVRVLINPDGTSVQEAHAAPVWVKNAQGKWADVDHTLVPRDGGFAPKASPSSVLIDGGGTKEFARMDLPGGGSMIWSWPESLPAPSVEGATATYAVADGVDLVVTATGLGVSTRIRINSAEAVVPDFTVQVRTDGVDLAQTDDGQLFFTDGKDRVGQTSTLTAWDGRLDQFGDPVEVVPVEASLEETASTGERTDQDLTLTTPAALVSDPEVVYPITIDPDVTPQIASQDTWVRNGTTTIDTLSYRVLVGRIASHANDNPAYGYCGKQEQSHLSSILDEVQMKYLIFSADFQHPSLLDLGNQEHIEVVSLDIDTSLQKRILDWNDQYQQIIPLGTSQRKQLAPLIDRLDLEGRRLAEELSLALPSQSKVQYYSEGRLQMLQP